jgi:hypothetical protein
MRGGLPRGNAVFGDAWRAWQSTASKRLPETTVQGFATILIMRSGRRCRHEAQSLEYLFKPAKRAERVVGPNGLPRGNVVFERLGQLLVDEFQREAFFEVSHDSRLDLAEHDKGFQRRPVFRGDGGAG